MTQELFTIDSLYIAGFTQARAPHIGLLLATSTTHGTLYHIRIDRETSPHWQFQRRVQKIDKDMFLSALVRVHDATSGAITDAQLQAAADAVTPPANDTFGECAPWVYHVLRHLHEAGVLEVKDEAALAEEVDDFARGSKAYARRDRFPNVMASDFCH
ncbi:hypothetical protein BDW22DRAFT_1347598 [Trametopsis cervina]|nr:hypothetical protein BDW22DRAFT_1347598 [Trametopsis cervina]